MLMAHWFVAGKLCRWVASYLAHPSGAVSGRWHIQAAQSQAAAALIRMGMRACASARKPAELG